MPHLSGCSTPGGPAAAWWRRGRAPAGQAARVWNPAGPVSGAQRRCTGPAAWRQGPPTLARTCSRRAARAGAWRACDEGEQVVHSEVTATAGWHRGKPNTMSHRRCCISGLLSLFDSLFLGLRPDPAPPHSLAYLCATEWHSTYTSSVRTSSAFLPRYANCSSSAPCSCCPCWSCCCSCCCCCRW